MIVYQIVDKYTYKRSYEGNINGKIVVALVHYWNCLNKHEHLLNFYHIFLLQVQKQKTIFRTKKVMYEVWSFW